MSTGQVIFADGARQTTSVCIIQNELKKNKKERERERERERKREREKRNAKEVSSGSLSFQWPSLLYALWHAHGAGCREVTPHETERPELTRS